jgi:hypothetical protein
MEALPRSVGKPHSCSGRALAIWAKLRKPTGAGCRENEQSNSERRGAVDAATQHVKTAHAASDLAQLQRQQCGAGGHVRRLACHRLRRSPVLVHLGTIGDHSDESQSRRRLPRVVRLFDRIRPLGDDISARTASAGHPSASLGHSQENDGALNSFEEMPGTAGSSGDRPASRSIGCRPQRESPAVEDLIGGFPRVLVLVQAHACLYRDLCLAKDTLMPP